jgi:anthranilate phosphoribosyltransferase
MKDILNELFSHVTLSRKRAKQILQSITNGEVNDPQIAAFLTVYGMRSVTVDELAGFRDAMLDQALLIDLKEFDPIDLCGTGGDGKNTFNISTLASFVTAGAGVPVAKHGNYGVSSLSGSSNVMEHLGMKFSNDPDLLKKQIEQARICFLHAPLFHPAMKSVAPIRRQLGTKTFFNMLGPLVNPARPRLQSVGVFSLQLARNYEYLFQREPEKRYAIIHDHAGYDEISLTGKARLATDHEAIDVSSELFGIEQISAEEIYGGNSVEESAQIFMRVLKNEATDAQNHVVLANAASAISIAKQISLPDAFEQAKESLVSGRTLKCFKTLIDLSA